MIRNRSLDEGVLAPTAKQSILILLNYIGAQTIYLIPGVLLMGSIYGFYLDLIMARLLEINLLAMMIALIIQTIKCYDLLVDSFKEFLRSIAKNIRVILICFAILFGSMLIFGLMYEFFGIEGSSANQENLIAISGNNRFGFILLAVVFAPLLEEMVFRGAIFASMRKHGRYILAFLVSSLAFGLLHIVADITELVFKWEQLLFLMQYSVLGLLMAIAYEKTGSIWSSIFLHALWNGFAVALMFMV